MDLTRYAHAGGAAALMAIAIAFAAQALAQGGGGGGGGGSSAGIPKFRILAAVDSAVYDDHARNELKGTEADRQAIKLSGSDVQVAGTYEGFETELASRTLAPKDLPYWTKRSELSLIESYYWDEFKWVQPAFGYFQATQTGDQADPDAPPAFINTNRGLVFGLHTNFPIYDFGGHGPMLQARIDYLTSLEKKRNFGTDRYLGLGYFYMVGSYRVALVAGQVRNYFNATKADPADSNYLLQVRHVYTVTRMGLYIEY